MREDRTFTDASRRMADALAEEYDARRRDDEQAAWDEYAARVRGVSADSWRSGAGARDMRNAVFQVHDFASREDAPSGAVIGMGLTGLSGLAVGLALGAWIF